MLDLVAKSPADGLVPVAIGTMTLDEVAPAAITFLTAAKGQEAALSAALKTAHGMALPAAQRATGRDGARAVWFGAEVALVGAVPDPSLSDHAAIVDQSDAWCVLRLTGDDLDAVLARLCPVDMRGSVFKRGHVVRSQLQHMNVVYHKLSENAVDIYGFRSMAATLVHDLKIAMESVESIS